MMATVVEPRLVRRSTALIVVLAVAAGGCGEISREELAERYDVEFDRVGTGSATSLPPTAAPEDANQPEIRSVDCPFDTSTVTDVECGEIDVPGRGLDPDYGITLTFARFFAQGPAEEVAPDPVVYLHGGPGASILSEVPFWYESVAAPHIDTRDVIFYDQRGAGFSTPLPTCHELHPLEDRVYGEAVDHRLLSRPFLEAMEGCAQRFAERTDVDLTAFTSKAHAADLADLRRALGFDSYNIHGSSYGTRLAQTVMRDHPEGVRALVLSGVYPIDANLTGAVPVSLESSLDAVFAACDADPTCGAALPDPWTALEELVASLDADPMAIAVPDTVTATVPVVFDGTDLLTALHQHLYTGFDAATVTDLLIDHLDGDNRRIERLAGASLYGLADVATFVTVQCAEEAPFTTDDERHRPLRREFLRAVDLAPSLTGPELLGVCETWDAAPPDPAANRPVTWDVPTLLLSGAIDPITPPEWGQLLADRLPDARHVVIPTLAHDANEGPCSIGIIAAFMARPDAPVDSSCAAWDRHLKPDNLASRFTDRTRPELVDDEFEIGGEVRSVRVPDWFADEDGSTHRRWRIIDSLDPTVLVLTGDDSDLALTEYLDVVGTAAFVAAPSNDSPAGWDRTVMETAGVDIIRYRHEKLGLQVALVVENGEEAALEQAVLLPAVLSMGAGA